MGMYSSAPPHCKKSKTKQKPWDKAEEELIVGEVGWKVGVIVFSPSNSIRLSLIYVSGFVAVVQVQKEKQKPKGLYRI